MLAPKNYTTDKSKLPPELAAELAATKKLYSVSAGKKQSAEHFAAATAVNEKLKALGLFSQMLFVGDAPEVAVAVAVEAAAAVIKDGDAVTGAALKKLAGSKKIQVMIDGGWPVEYAASDISDDEVFYADVNYAHRVNFHLGSIDDSTIVMIDGVVGTCDEMLGWIVKNSL